MQSTIVTLVGFWSKPSLDENGVVIEESTIVEKFGDNTIFQAENSAEGDANHYVKAVVVEGEISDLNLLLTAKPKTVSLFRSAFNPGSPEIYRKAWNKVQTGSKLSLADTELNYKVKSSNDMNLDALEL